MVLDTVHKRKSFALTSVIMIMLIFLMFLVGMKYLDPPEERGITITFGTDVKGMGEIQPPTSSFTPPAPIENQPEEPVEEEPIEEEVVNQSIEEETIVLPEKKESKPKREKKPKVEKVKEIDKAKKQEKTEKPKPSSETTDALANILGATKQSDSKGGGQGDDNIAGYKGSLDGDPYSNSFYGSGGSGGSGTGKGWGLNGRNLEGGQKIPQECNESGRVVVQIEVDRSGKVVKVTPGVRGTTNSAPCLIEAAKKTAQTYRWNSDEKAPQRQIGFIVINFSLGE